MLQYRKIKTKLHVGLCQSRCTKNCLLSWSIRTRNIACLTTLLNSTVCSMRNACPRICRNTPAKAVGEAGNLHTCMSMWSRSAFVVALAVFVQNHVTHVVEELSVGVLTRAVGCTSKTQELSKQPFGCGEKGLRPQTFSQLSETCARL